MKTLVIGSHGKIGRILCRKAATYGLQLRAMVRDASQASELTGPGVEVVEGDLEGAFAETFDGCDRVVFTAGSGGHTGGDKTLLVDTEGRQLGQVNGLVVIIAGDYAFGSPVRISATARMGSGTLIIEQPMAIGGCGDGEDFVAQDFECDLTTSSDEAMLCINRFTAADGVDYEYPLVFSRS